MIAGVFQTSWDFKTPKNLATYLKYFSITLMFMLKYVTTSSSCY